MYKWFKRVNVFFKVFYFNVWKVYNLIYYIVFQKYFIIISFIYMKIFVFMDEDVFLIKILNVVCLGFFKFNYLKNLQFYISIIIKIIYVCIRYYFG